MGIGFSLHSVPSLSKYRHTFRRGHETGGALAADRLHEIDDRLPGGCVVPRLEQGFCGHA